MAHNSGGVSRLGTPCIVAISKLTLCAQSDVGITELQETNATEPPVHSKRDHFAIDAS